MLLQYVFNAKFTSKFNHYGKVIQNSAYDPYFEKFKSVNPIFDLQGIAGTEVAKEASDIIITDDNFISIVKVGGTTPGYLTSQQELLISNSISFQNISTFLV